MKSKNVYDLALIKIKQSLNKVEIMIKEKSKQKIDLENIIKEEKKRREEIKREIDKASAISPIAIYGNQAMDLTVKEQVLKKIERVNKELLILKKEYSRIKQRRDKVLQHKEKKEQEREEMRVMKEMRELQSDYISKRYLD